MRDDHDQSGVSAVASCSSVRVSVAVHVEYFLRLHLRADRTLRPGTSGPAFGGLEGGRGWGKLSTPPTDAAVGGRGTGAGEAYEKRFQMEVLKNN